MDVICIFVIAWVRVDADVQLAVIAMVCTRYVELVFLIMESMK